MLLHPFALFLLPFPPPYRFFLSPVLFFLIAFLFSRVRRSLDPFALPLLMHFFLDSCSPPHRS
jgi:hypothetical protein